MNKTTKGALGASAAAVLLLGGAGSLAYWTDNATVNGGSVNAGNLSIDAVDGCDALPWTYAGKTANTGTVVNFVPGDVISKTCTFVIGAEGDNLAATPVIPDSVDIKSAAATFEATVAATYELAGADYTGAAITEDNDGDTLAVTFEVTIPFGTDEDAADVVNGNSMQDADASLDALTVSLSQDNPNA